jgi:hypothetical protein
MDSIVEAKAKDFLWNWLHCNPYDGGTIVECIRASARMAGHDLDERFANAELWLELETRVVPAIVD